MNVADVVYGLLFLVTTVAGHIYIVCWVVVAYQSGGRTKSRISLFMPLWFLYRRSYPSISQPYLRGAMMSAIVGTCAMISMLVLVIWVR